MVVLWQIGCVEEFDVFDDVGKFVADGAGGGGGDGTGGCTGVVIVGMTMSGGA